jgi:hypothetical protein
MSKAEQNNTPPAPLDARFLSEPDGWMWIGEAFSRVTDIVGDPNEALHDIRRELLAERVRSLRLRPLHDDVKKDELNRTFWRGIELFAGSDKQGREVVGLRLAEGVDAFAVSGCIFYLFQADVDKAWPQVTEPASPGMHRCPGCPARIG